MENHESKRVLRGDTGALYLQLPATDKENPTVDSNSSASEHTHTHTHNHTHTHTHTHTHMYSLASDQTRARGVKSKTAREYKVGPTVREVESHLRS